ncbi:MAG: alpha/beta fold hydrolase, partial [Anaerolineae bacterium]|nr:alpha/beta fold hydrolase [Anaerolineae bacterium]
DPALACPELDETVIDLFGLADPDAIELEQRAQAADACFKRLRDLGIDPTQYNTETIAADIEALRQALGYQQLNLFGLSYSTRLALHYARTYPASTRALVLDSVVPPDVNQYETHIDGFQRSFTYLASQCTDQLDACDETLAANFQQAVERLNTNPAEVEILHPLTGEPFTFRVTGYDFAAGVFQALYHRATIEITPYLIEQVAAGNNAVLSPLAQSGAEDVLGGEWGLFYAIQCMDEYPFNNAERVVLDRNRIPFLPEWHTQIYGSDQAVCTRLKLPPTQDSFRQPVEVNMPVIILAGSYDPITPPAWAEQVAANLPAAYLYTFPSASHVVYFEDTCAQALVVAFLDDPTRMPADCSKNGDSLQFVASNDILSTRAFYRLNTVLDQPKLLVTLILPFIGLSFFLVQILHSLVSLVQRNQASPAYWLATLIAVTGIAIVVMLILISSDTREIILGFGLPASGIGVGLLLLVQIVLILALMMTQFRRVKQSANIYLSVFTVVSTAFVGWLVWMHLY